MTELLQSDLFQFLALLCTVIGGTSVIVWKVAQFSNRMLNKQEQHDVRITRLEAVTEQHSSRIHKVELAVK